MHGVVRVEEVLVVHFLLLLQFFDFILVHVLAPMDFLDLYIVAKHPMMISRYTYSILENKFKCLDRLAVRSALLEETDQTLEYRLLTDLLRYACVLLEDLFN